MAITTHNRTIESDADCNGCGVCMLSCPVWQQSHTQALTMCGRARAVMGGAAEEDLAESAKACILCGSCAPLCPRGLDTQRATMALRQRLAAAGLLPKIGAVEQAAPENKAFGRVLLPGAALRGRREILDRCLALFGEGVGCGADDGADVCLDLEAGGLIGGKRLETFLAPLRKAREIIASDGLMVNVLTFLLGSKIRIRSLGEALLANDRVRRGVRSTDLYLIETRAFNSRRAEQVMLYESLRRETGCLMNLDLHRVATPTGAVSYQHRMSLPTPVSIEKQIQWLLEGRNAQRIVVEHLDDGAAFERHASIPVAHLAEVAEL